GSCAPWRQFGRPRLFFAISAGNMDSLINHYTANRKLRNDDAYSPGGRIGLRPDRATLSYCHRAREAFPRVPIIAGGVEASLRRLAHYDYWSETVRRSILLDSKADLLVYGMGEKSIIDIAQRLAAGQSVRDLRDLRGVGYVLGASETPEVSSQKSGVSDQESGVSDQESGVRGQEPRVRSQESGVRSQSGGEAFLTPDSCSLTPDSRPLTPDSWDRDAILLPSYEDVKA